MVGFQPSKLIARVRFSHPAPNKMIEPKVNCYYQHRYGGLYIVKDIAKSSVDQSKWVVYNHVYPFEYETWIRPYAEWCDGRFRKVEHEEYAELLMRDRAEFQMAVTATRNAAKG
jgi:hypothetical protein